MSRKERIDLFLNNSFQRKLTAKLGEQFVKNTFTFEHQVTNLINLAK